MRLGPGSKWLKLGKRTEPAAPGDGDERRRLADALAHEREKVAKLKRRLALAEADRDTVAAEARALHVALTRGRQLPKIGTAEAPAFADAAARAGLRARTRGLDLERQPDGPSLAGGLFRAAPPAIGVGASPWRPLRVALASSTISAFQACDDPRMIVRPLGDRLVEDADVLVFPGAESKAYLQDAGLVPEGLWRRVADGRTRLVLDASGEGHAHRGEDSVDHHRFLEAHGADPGSTLYLTQDRQYGAAYGAWCAATSTRPMQVFVFDAFVGRVLAEFEASGRQVFNHRLAQFLKRPAQRGRRFLSLNYTPRPTKVLFLLRLLRDGLWDQGWISFGGFASGGEGEGLTAFAVAKRLRALEGFEDEIDELLPLMARLEAMEPVLFMDEKLRLEGKLRTRAVEATDFDQYGDCWFTVVTETEMRDGLHRITEKPLKPLLGLHPFLILGGPGSLALLRGYGFETFGDLLDERYDEEPDPRRRFDMVYDEVRRLCAMDEAELARLSEALSEIVIFNACWGLTELPRRFSGTLGGALVDQVLAS